MMMMGLSPQYFKTLALFLSTTSFSFIGTFMYPLMFVSGVQVINIVTWQIASLAIATAVVVVRRFFLKLPPNVNFWINIALIISGAAIPFFFQESLFLTFAFYTAYLVGNSDTIILLSHQLEVCVPQEKTSLAARITYISNNLGIFASGVIGFFLLSNLTFRPWLIFLDIGTSLAVFSWVHGNFERVESENSNRFAIKKALNFRFLTTLTAAIVVTSIFYANSSFVPSNFLEHVKDPIKHQGLTLISEGAFSSLFGFLVLRWGPETFFGLRSLFAIFFILALVVVSIPSLVITTSIIFVIASLCALESILAPYCSVSVIEASKSQGLTHRDTAIVRILFVRFSYMIGPIFSSLVAVSGGQFAAVAYGTLLLCSGIVLVLSKREIINRRVIE